MGWDAWPDHMERFEDVAKVLNVRDVEVNKKGIHCNAQRISGDNRMLLRIVRDIILHSSSQDQRLTQHEMVFLNLFNRGEDICLPHVIVLHLQRALNSSNTAWYPYGGLVTHIMKKWAILVNERKPTIKATPLTAQSLTGTLVLHQGQFLWQADFRRDPAAPPPPARQPSQRSQPLRRSTSLPTCDHEQQFRRIDKRLNKMDKKFSRFEKFWKMLGKKMGCSKAELDILDTRRPRVREEAPSQVDPVVETEEVEAEGEVDAAAAGEEDLFDISVLDAEEDEDDGGDDEDDDDEDEDDDDDDAETETESG